MEIYEMAHILTAISKDCELIPVEQTVHKATLKNSARGEYNFWRPTLCS